MMIPIPRRLLALLSSAVLALQLTQLTALHAADLSAGYSWNPMKIGGGGWVTGLDISPTEKDLVYVRTDVSGGYRWNAVTASWIRIVTAASMPAGSLNYGDYDGVESLVGAPKDPAIAYMAFVGKPYQGGDGEIYKSTNRGETWTATNFVTQKVRMDPNGEGRQEGERLAVDPVNSDVVYYGSINNGLWFTQNGGTTWSQVEAIPNGTAKHGVNNSIFDRASGTTQKKTNVIYVTVDGGGVFKTTDSGRTWKLISSAATSPAVTAGSSPSTTPPPAPASAPASANAPTNAAEARDATVGPDRTFYVVYDSDKKAGAAGSVWKYSSTGAWTEITPPVPNGGDKSWWAIAVNPANANHVVAMIHGGRAFVSYDQGNTWAFHGFQLKSEHVDWQEKQSNYFLSVGEIAFDPFRPDTLWFAEGFGVWQAKAPTAKTPVTKNPVIEWHSVSAGIEEACGNDVIAPPGGRPVAAMWDLGAFYFSNVDTYTAQKSHPGFMSAWALDWCAAEPKFIAGVFRSHLDFVPKANSSGYSTDGGQTWTRFAALENNTAPKDLQFGVIAVSAKNTDNIVWSPAPYSLPYYTKDRGATWMRSVLGEAPKTGLASYPMSQKPLCADRVLADTFYFYTPQNGVFRSKDGGANFVLVSNPAHNQWNAILKSTPGHAGHLWLAGGADGGAGLFRSTDGGDNFTKIAGLQPVFNVALGKAQNANGYPTLFVAGIKDGKHGIYRSTDEGKTWDKIGDYPLGITDRIDAMDGDKDTFGKVYVTFAGSGFAYGALNTAVSK